MDTTRRAFLVRSALSAPWIYGLAELQGRQSPPQDQQPQSRPAAPQAWKLAREAMRTRKAPGLAIAVPAKPAEREALLLFLNDLLEPRHFEGLALFARAVVVCVVPEALPLGPGENVVLVDAEGTRIAGAKIAFQVGNELGKSIEALHALIDGHENPKWAERTSRTPAAGQRELAVLLRGGHEEDLRAARKGLLESCQPGSYMLWRWRVSQNPAEKGYCAEVLWNRLHAAPDAPKPLPYGIVETPHPNPPQVDACPPCGMAIVSRRSLYVLEFLTDEAKPR